MSENNKVVLVTGGAGYIGSHAVLALKEAGFNPVVVDNLVTGNRFALDPLIPFHEGNIGNPVFMREVCEEHKPVALMHFAASIEVGESQKDPKKYWLNNFCNAAQLFNTVRVCGVQNIVFSSTAAVYGMPHDTLPLKEDAPLEPINVYGRTKLATEGFLRNLDNVGVHSVTLRYFNAAGAAATEHNIGEGHWPETHLVPNALLAVSGQKPGLNVFGDDYPTPDGTAVRDYIHVSDLADAHVKAIRYLLEGGKTEILNLGTGCGNSVMEIIKTVENVTGQEVPYTIAGRREGDPSVLVADATKAKEILGWEPVRGLPEIIESAYAWHQSATYGALLVQKL
jgi:UDP-glucose-4-epimerase GalE